MVEKKPIQQTTVTNLPAYPQATTVGGATLQDPNLIEPGTTKIHFQNPQTETAFQGLSGIREGIPPSNEAVIVGIEQAKQSILSSENLLTREGKNIQRDTLILLDLIKMIIEDRNSDEKMQQFLICFRNLTEKYAPEFGEDLRFGVQRGYETSQKGTGRDLYNSIVGLRDFVFQLIKSSEFRESISELFQYIQILGGEVVDEKGSGSIFSKFATGITHIGLSDEPIVHDTTSVVVSGVSGGSLNLEHLEEHSLLPSQVKSEDELKTNQGKLSEPGEAALLQQQQQQGQQGQYLPQQQQQQQYPYQQGQQQQQGSQFGQQQQPLGVGSSGISSIGNVPSKEEYPGYGVQQQQQPYQTGVSQQQQFLPQEQQQQQFPSQQGSEPLVNKPFGSYESNLPEWQGGISRQQPLGVQSPTQQWSQGTGEGMSPGGGVGHYPSQNIVDDQYREPTQQSNVQAQQFRPVGGESWQQQQQQPYQTGVPQQQWQPSDVTQSSAPSNIPKVPQNIPQPRTETHDKSKKEIEDSLIDRYVQLNKRFSKDPNYQKALFGLFSIFNEVKHLFDDTSVQESGKTKTVERLKEDDDFRSLLNYAKLILYEFSDKQLMDKWLDTTNAFFVHLRTDERLRHVLKDMMNDFKRYGKEPTLLESHQEKEQLRTRLAEFRRVFEEKKNMDLTNDMLTYGSELLTSMKNDELNAEIRERSQKLMKRLFLDEHGKFTLKPSALEQIRTILFVAVQEAINNWNMIEVEGDDGTQYFKISNVVLKANDILPDDVKFKVKNRTSMKYEELKPSDRLAESATLISAHLFGMTAHLKDVNFMFDRRSFPSISDNGVMDIDFDRGGISFKLKLKARLSHNRPFYVKKIGVSVDTLHIKFKQAQKHKLMLKMLSPIIQNRVRRKIHDNLEIALNNNVRELVERLNDLIENTIIQGNIMAGEGAEGGIITGIMGRVGITKAQPEESTEDYPQEGGAYLRSSRASRVSGQEIPITTPTVPVGTTSSSLGSEISPQITTADVSTAGTRPVVQQVSKKERTSLID